MKKVLFAFFTAAVILSCNDSGTKTDDPLNQTPVDSTSDMPAPPTIDTSNLQTDSIAAEQAIRK
jgi:hypothetical protein